MIYTNHIGHNVCAITGMGYSYPGYKSDEVEFENFEKLLKELKFKYLLAVTNCYQVRSCNILKNNGFKKKVTFLSSHNRDDETLTVWVKVNKKAANLSKGDITYPSRNCSITYDKSAVNLRCCLIAAPAKSNPDGFKRIAGTPIWFKIEDCFIVNSKSKVNEIINVSGFKPVK